MSLGSSPPRPGVGRRPLLVGAGLAALASATGCSWLDRTPETPAPEVHPDRALLTAAREDESTLLAAVQQTAQTHAGLAATLAPVTARTQERLAALDRALGAEAGGAPTASSEDTTSRATAPPTPAVPARPAAALNALATQSRTAQQARAADCVRATDQGVARLLASVAAGDGQDVLVLRSARSAL
ncbi:hypothetical protein [Mumia sp. DW29H23]|uniref:hypothetical protein n=1 Tax=Mumia sp. DW29H23 TaxID=3421241 RepID=UPI003D695208